MALQAVIPADIAFQHAQQGIEQPTDQADDQDGRQHQRHVGGIAPDLQLLTEAFCPGYQQFSADQGTPRETDPHSRVIFGPTCDSVDRLPGEMALPTDIEEGDYVVFHGAGAYSTVTNTRFNGFGAMSHATVMALG